MTRYRVGQEWEVNIGSGDPTIEWASLGHFFCRQGASNFGACGWCHRYPPWHVIARACWFASAKGFSLWGYEWEQVALKGYVNVQDAPGLENAAEGGSVSEATAKAQREAFWAYVKARMWKAAS